MVKLDFIVLAVFALMIFFIGFAFTRIGSKNSQSFFEAGGAIPWWINGLSLFISYFSAGTFVVWGSIAYQHGLVANTIQLTMAISGALVALFIAQKWKKTGARTAAEFIGNRFGLATQKFYTYLVLLLSLFSTASVLYPVGKMVHVATPFSLETCIIIIGVIIVLYTAAGGLWAVLVTDVIQFVILTASVLIVLPIAFSAIGGPSKLISDAPQGFFNLFNEEYTLPFMVGFVLYQTAYIGGNWSYVQRYTSVRSTKESKKVAWLFTALYLVSPLIWMLPPMIYRVMDAELAGLGSEGAYMMLCQKILPPGLIGLVLAGMISATSSKANTTINLAATVFSTDLYRNIFRKNANDKELILIARLFTILFGGATVLLAIYIPHMGGIVDFVLTVAAMAGGAIFMPIIWSLFSGRQTAKSVVTVTLFTLVFNLLLKFALPSLMDIKLSRTWETIIGQCTPLLMLSLFEFLYRKNPSQVMPIQRTEDLLSAEEVGGHDQEIKQQNAFGLKVITLSMVIIGLGIFLLGAIAGESYVMVMFTGLFISALSVIIWLRSKKAVALSLLIIVSLGSFKANAQRNSALQSVLVNQAGYDENAPKRFVAWGAKEGVPFVVRSVTDKKVVFQGNIQQYSGDFTSFKPKTAGEFFIEVQGYQPSVPFQVRPFHMATISTKLAYDFFMDVRGSTDPKNSNEAKVYSGGPSRDCGAYTLETIFETMFYASNPAVFDNWKKEMGNDKIPDLIALILWHAEFAYYHHAYNGPVATRHGWVGYEGKPKMQYDYWNTLDQLAAVCAAYHVFLKPYLSEERYQAYRKLCNEKWEEYERHKVLRYWTYSTKWVDPGYQEFNEMGHAFGQSIFSNLFMYITESHEKNGQPDKYMAYAKASAEDVIKNWDFNNIRHMWWIRNAEHITPQSLAFFQMTFPDKAPAGTKEKLSAWMDHILSRTSNPWHYRVHNETEWAHPKTKELGGAPALGGSLFAASHVLNRPEAIPVAWSQINFTFGLNPLGAHFSNKSKERLDIDGYWPGIEKGWPQSHPNGYGMLGKVRGTLDGTPLDHDFPRFAHQQTTIKKDSSTDNIGMFAYATEGWAISNRGWISTLSFLNLQTTGIRVVDKKGKTVKESKGNQPVYAELTAPLNIHQDQPDQGWIELTSPKGETSRIIVKETMNDSGVFRAVLPLSSAGTWTLSYGYWGFKKTATIMLQK